MPSVAFSSLKVTQKCVGGRAQPLTQPGSFSAPLDSDSLAQFQGREREGKGWKGLEREGKGRGGPGKTMSGSRGGGKGKGREGKGRGEGKGRKRKGAGGQDGRTHPPHHEILDPPLLMTLATNPSSASSARVCFSGRCTRLG